MKHKWLGDICTVCGIQRRTVKRLNAQSQTEYFAEYFDKNGNKFPARPICKLNN
jgi:uncharacterized protein (DUF2252 family)